MGTSKFSIGGLMGVHLSSIGNEVIKTISSQFIFFVKKFWAHKTKSNQNQPPKQKQVNKKQQRQQFFAYRNLSEGKHWLFCVS